MRRSRSMAGFVRCLGVLVLFATGLTAGCGDGAAETTNGTQPPPVEDDPCPIGFVEVDTHCEPEPEDEVVQTDNFEDVGSAFAAGDDDDDGGSIPENPTRDTSDLEINTGDCQPGDSFTRPECDGGDVWCRVWCPLYAECAPAEFGQDYTSSPQCEDSCERYEQARPRHYPSCRALVYEITTCLGPYGCEFVPEASPPYPSPCDAMVDLYWKYCGE